MPKLFLFGLPAGSLVALFCVLLAPLIWIAPDLHLTPFKSHLGRRPDFCADGCISDCDAHAECGEFALPANKTCPLNVCCSEFGFCGTTTDFWFVLWSHLEKKAESNCVEHPKPPAAATGKALSRGDWLVIGYYEGWNARSKCHQTKPEDLPRGWTFSDNNTATQPLLGIISADEGKRAKFVSNTMKFLNRHGFDGFDLDCAWLDITLKLTKGVITGNTQAPLTAGGHGRSLELTFTIPASYWYLRWFDVPELLKYADWTNFMSYDIHGIWDRESQIGSIVQRHTNLTEIKFAAALLWRNNVNPSKVTLGYGFYGQSFTLADPSCSKPGCVFSDAAKPGVCTGTGGYLAYYELMDILGKKDITPVWDKEAAVKYFNFDSGQWVSFDDKETFKQKLDWANDVGLSGALIWASDLDDYDFSAHTGLLGEDFASNIKIREETISAALSEAEAITAMDASLDTSCYRVKDCVSIGMFHCDKGYSQMGWDLEGCQANWPFLYGGFGRPICCKTAVAPEKCMWRGDGLDCNGQCHDGEATLYKSKNGGAFSSKGTVELQDLRPCNRGEKAFCCMQNNFAQLTNGCYWSDCGDKCKYGELDIASTIDLDGKCNSKHNGRHYCCKGIDKPLTNCHWVGQGDCADNTCNAKEVTLARDSIGDNKWNACLWRRKKDLCCTVNTQVTEYKCARQTCDYDGDFRCDIDPEADDESLDETDENGNDLPEDEVAARSELLAGKDKGKGKAKVFKIELVIDNINFIATLVSRLWPGATHLHDRQRGRNAVPASDLIFQPDRSTCSSTEIIVTRRKDWTKKEIEDKLDTEHNPDAQYSRDLFKTLGTGALPNGQNSTQPVVPFGSQGNRSPMLLADREMNQFKGRIFNIEQDAMASDTFRDNLAEVMNNNFHGLLDEQAAIERLFNPIRITIAVFRYIRHPDVLPVIQGNRRKLLEATQRISANVLTLGNAHALHEEFDSL
ncbi:glycosyl hydrolases family 18-domain-containing protein [Phialemonium atrogriseum]|uniref:chitinase n=1 Tax=Phialemonium atrogriseum TaxID=1093897 RepID=A0AAJ0FKB8_9PEZI|nr:glycosyl hydrolases family 18-domain-containing protein [Phialemonium atrogriseum]KAK1771446.1 glycosyl hydrolases family 18-domain-containing protein [Phialemonium atrogriseum]